MNNAEIPAQYIFETETALDSYLKGYENSPVVEAMRYSTLGGGKRVRACLVLSSCVMLGGDASSAIPYAAAIEMIHAYSLIHDDLPCMDDDDLRRGKPSCHKQFGESVAVLAGDALLTKAFEVIAQHGKNEPVRAVLAVAKAAGCCGMVRGQELDIDAEGKDITEAELVDIHTHKTGALMKVCATLGAIAAGADPQKTAAVERYAQDIGLVFQVVDDILDCVSTTETLGKQVGSDSGNEKKTFVDLYGIGKAREYAIKINDRAKAAIIGFGQNADYLIDFADSLLKRIN